MMAAESSNTKPYADSCPTGITPSGTPLRYVDAHMHLDLMKDPGEDPQTPPNGTPLTASSYVEHTAAEGIGLFAATVTPGGFARISAEFAAAPHVRVGLGLHPWWIEGAAPADRMQLEAFLDLLPSTRYVGEVGLDFAPAHQETRSQQLHALEEILTACIQQGGKVITLHCVRAYDELLSLLRATDAIRNNTCILHWFSGTHDDLLAARDLGCWFSVGERLLSSKRGRAYVHAMPTDRLLLETDAPPLGGGIAAAYRLLSLELGEDAARATTRNGSRLLGFDIR